MIRRSAHLILLAILADCGGVGAGVCSVCPTGETCFQDRCTASCTDTRPCRTGHACVPSDADSGVNACDPTCQDDLCPDHMACQGYSCALVACAERIPCTEQGTFCDTTVPRCRPISGECSKADDCPTYLSDIPVSCKEGFCRVRRDPETISDAPTESIEVYSPTYGTVVGAEDELLFAWVPPVDAVVIVLVLDSLPYFWGGIGNRAIWGAYLSRDKAALTPSMTWPGGTAILDGKWQSDGPGVPGDRPLYLLIEAFADGELVAASAPILFKVGTPWPKPQDECDQGNPTSCDAPLVPMTCLNSACQAFCGSAADCAPFGLACGIPNGYKARFCE